MGFNINDFMNAESKREIKNDWKPVKISVHKLKPAAGKENFYHMDDKEVEETARTIELVGIQQYPVVRPIEGTDEYEIIAGHKRRLAILKLIAEGKTEFEMIPCKIESTEDSIRNRLILIFTNSTQRERTDFEKMNEIKEVRKLLEEWHKNNKLPGKKQNIIAQILGTNKTKIGTLENIEKNLIAEFKEEFAAGGISTSAANEIAGLENEAQQALYETYKETGSLIAKDVKAAKEPNEPQEQQKEQEAKNDTPRQEKTENEAQEKPQPQIMDEQDTKAIEETENDLKYCADRTVKDLISVSNYLTESEIYILQDIIMKCKERAGKQSANISKKEDQNE
jgi:ParB family chromosome partitioning protein